MAIRLLYDFKFDDATITSSSESGELIDDNAVDDFVDKKWRTTGDATEWIKFEFAAAQLMTMVGIFGHNFTDAAVVTLEASSDDDWEGEGDPEYSGAFTWNERSMILFPTGDPSFKFWRLTIADAANPDTYIEIGRICGGEYLEPSIGVSTDVRKTWIDPSVTDSAYGRQRYAIIRPKYREFRGRIDDMPRIDQDNLTTLFHATGNVYPLVLSLDPINYPNEDSIFCLLKSSLDFSLRMINQGTALFFFEEQVS